MKLKNTAKAIGAITISILLLTSCVALPPESVSDVTDSAATEQSDSFSAVLPPADNGKYGQRASEIADSAIRNAIVLLAAHPAAEISSGAPVPTLRRDRLSAPVRDIYDMLLAAVDSVGAYEWDSVSYGETAFSDFMEADEALRADNPRCRAYYYPDVSGNIYRPIYFLPGTSNDQPTDDTQEITARMELFDAVCKRIVECMPDGLSDLGKYRYFAAVITGRCEYDSSLSTMSLPYPAYNALVNGSAVCSGYASAMEHLCGEAGLFCMRTDGTKDGGNHAWNRICLSGSYYYCDLTAADASAPGSNAWLECIAITAKRAKSGNYVPFRKDMTADGTDDIR